MAKTVKKVDSAATAAGPMVYVERLGGGVALRYGKDRMGTPIAFFDGIAVSGREGEGYINLADAERNALAVKAAIESGQVQIAIQIRNPAARLSPEPEPKFAYYLAGYDKKTSKEVMRVPADDRLYRYAVDLTGEKGAARIKVTQAMRTEMKRFLHVTLPRSGMDFYVERREDYCYVPDVYGA